MNILKEHKWTIIIGIIVVVVIISLLLAPIDIGPRYSQESPEKLLEKRIAGINLDDKKMVLDCSITYFGPYYDKCLADEQAMIWIYLFNCSVNSIDIVFPENMNESEIQEYLDLIETDEYAYDVSIQSYCITYANISVDWGDEIRIAEEKVLCYQINGAWYRSNHDIPV